MLGNQFCFTFLLTCPHRDGSRAQSNGGPVITYEDAYQGNGTRDLRQTFDSERSTDDECCLCLFLASLMITTDYYELPLLTLLLLQTNVRTSAKFGGALTIDLHLMLFCSSN